MIYIYMSNYGGFKVKYHVTAYEDHPPPGLRLPTEPWLGQVMTRRGATSRVSCCKPGFDVFPMEYPPDMENLWGTFVLMYFLVGFLGYKII